jgi:hypothetical protein
MTKIHRKKMKGGLERLVLLGIITNTQFIDKIKTILDRKAFSSEASRTIVKWCMDYYTEHNKAPYRDISIIWDNKSIYLNEELYETTQELLEQLSDEMDRRGNDFTCSFALGQALEFFQQKALEISAEELQDLLDSGDLTGARELVRNIELPEYGEQQVESTNILTDPETLRKGFEDQSEPLIYMPNYFGRFINKLLVRKGFLGILGPEKRKKTWTLNELAMQGLKAKKNVAIFNAGDLDNEEQSVRFAIRISKRSNDPEYCGAYYSPVLDCKWNQDNSCTRSCRKSKCGIGGVEIVDPDDVELAPPEYRPCRVCCGDNHYRGAVWYRRIEEVNPLTWQEALAANTKFLETHNITDRHLRVRSYAADTLTVNDADRLLEEWAIEDGYTPDIIIFDYIDIMAPDSKFVGTRHAENEKWKAMGKLRHKYNCLVATCTQTAASAYEHDTIQESDFSEDKRKYSHVTGFITLNQTVEEANLGIMRIGRFMCRHMKPTKAQVTILQSIERGMIHVGSFFNNE